jgi:hypothetical protein
LMLFSQVMIFQLPDCLHAIRSWSLDIAASQTFTLSLWQSVTQTQRTNFYQLTKSSKWQVKRSFLWYLSIQNSYVIVCRYPHYISLCHTNCLNLFISALPVSPNIFYEVDWYKLQSFVFLQVVFFGGGWVFFLKQLFRDYEVCWCVRVHEWDRDVCCMAGVIRTAQCGNVHENVIGIAPIKWGNVLETVIMGCFDNVTISCLKWSTDLYYLTWRNC